MSFFGPEPPDPAGRPDSPDGPDGPGPDRQPPRRLMAVVGGLGAAAIVLGALVGFTSDPPIPLPEKMPTMPSRPGMAPPPSGWPTELPSDFPTGLPSDLPSDFPTGLPSDFPTDFPTGLPSGFPSDFPTAPPGPAPQGGTP
ncbi:MULTISPECIES: PT domain-containing protein [unclassified Streptomyces]|uniref:PT domain-containing protein n=1 Tax=unclassified Streptomyces TaxID=2593676 RepID=UPI000978ED3B|nr:MULTISPECIES: PT domain-containing protein [unclassified Streptomyces]ONI50336.1 PT repeat protein [Streptomyces sp. IB2014 011-1]